jgi:hypothetical protein
MFSYYETIPSTFSAFERYSVPSVLRMEDKLLHALLDLARLKNIGVGFSLFRQLKSFIDFTLSKVSASRILFNLPSSVPVSVELLAKSCLR